MTYQRLLAGVFVAVAIVAMACGGDKNAATTEPTAAPASGAPQPTAAAALAPPPTNTPEPPPTPPPPPTQAPPPPPPPPPPTQAVSRQPMISLSPNPVPVGGTVTVSGSGFQPGSQITVVGQSGPISLPLGTGTADGQGSFTGSNTVPALIPPGTYTIVATDAARNSASTQITVR